MSISYDINRYQQQYRKHHKTTNHARIRRQWAAKLCEILT